jgi:carboxy-cis,cis-muconate cyclase
MSLSTSSTGALTGILDTWSYINTSGIHGLALSPPNTTPLQNNSNAPRQLLYSADLNGDLLWTHTINPATGRATEASRWPMTAAGMHPRHLAVHPNGAHLYAVMEVDNSVAEYVLDPSTGAVLRERVRHMLIPTDTDTADYWSAEVMLSSDNAGPPRYLWATARGKYDNTTGFVSVFLLGDDGRIVKRMFRVPTTTKGGIANAVSPAFWGEEYAAMTDYPVGYVLMWKMEGRRERADGLVEYTTARDVARVDIGDGECCANAIWYS